MAYESIDKSETSAYELMIDNIVNYIKEDITSPKERLAIERKLKEFQQKNQTLWLLNLIIVVSNRIKDG
jgi:hypothetical protein